MYKRQDITPLIIAGGGGGGSYYGYTNDYMDGLTTTAGGRGYGCTTTGDNGAAGGYCGSTNNTGAPGAGVTGESTTSFYSNQTAGDAFITGGVGGYGSSVYSTRPNGGFGGGGGGSHGCCYGSGGGGGYSGGTGGDGCGSGGGGGSYSSSSTNKTMAAGVREGHGLVTIEFCAGFCFESAAVVANNNYVDITFTAGALSLIHI